MAKTFLILAVTCLIVVGLTAANLRRQSQSSTASSTPSLNWQLLPSPPREVVLQTPRLAAITETITAPGEVEFVEEANIASQVVGRVVKVNVRDGDKVQKDQVLVQLDETDARARLDSAHARIQRLEAAILQARAERDISQRNMNRVSQLAPRGVVTSTELADVRSGLEKMEALLSMSLQELAESKMLLRTSVQDLDRTTIRAPIDGVVAGLDVEVGEVVIAGTINLPGTVLMTVGDPAKMRVRADVDQTDMPLVRPGQRARIFLLADPTHPATGSVDRVASKGLRMGDVVTFESLINVEGSHESLKAGMSATVEIEVKHTDSALSIPVQAVVHRRVKDLPDSPALKAWVAKLPRAPGEAAREIEASYVKLVFVVSNGQARARPVETGLSDERSVEILAGLENTDVVVIGPFRTLDQLKEGDPVIEVQQESESGERPS